MFKRVSRLRTHAALVLALCAPLLLTFHAAAPARAITTPTYSCQAPACAQANATFVIAPFTDVQVLIYADGFIVLTDLAGNPLPANYCDTTVPTGATTTGLTACTTSSGASGFLVQVHVILPANYILTIVTFNANTGSIALVPASGNYLVPGTTYAITNLNNPLLYCGILGIPC